jgi:hypothetical protein
MATAIRKIQWSLPAVDAWLHERASFNIRGLGITAVPLPVSVINLFIAAALSQ